MTETVNTAPLAPYTPGPWSADLDYIVAPDPHGRHPDIYIAEIAHSDDEGRVASYEQQHANRQLIAAVPDLLEALQYVDYAIGDPGNVAPDAILEVQITGAGVTTIRAAIAKARS